jgi:ankyrin repeat protein
MKQLLTTIAAVVLVVGCSDPEAEANKLFTEASQLVREADAITEPYSLEAYNKRKAAVELLEKIPTQYPQSSLSVKISEGNFKTQSQSLDEIREKMKPNISIHEAVTEGNIEVIKQHLTTGADVNAKGALGGTPLHYAANWGQKEIAELLIAKGADVNAKDEQGFTPLDLAVLGGKKESADLLRKHGGISGAEDSIYVATTMGNIEAVKQHIAAGTDVNAKGKLGRTPLHKAAVYAYKEIAELLIAAGADVNAKNKDEGTPLYIAAWEGHKEIADLLIAKGADVNAKDELGGTPLHYAAKNGHKEIAELLITKGADVNAKIDKAHYANDVRIDDGSTPLDYAAGETIALLRKHGGKTGEELKAEGK